MTKLFLGGLPQTCSTEIVRDHFSQFGNLTDAVCMEGRGFGFVTFESPDDAAAVLGMEHVFEGRPCDIKEATKEGTKGCPKGKGGTGWVNPFGAGGKYGPPQVAYGGGGYAGGGAYVAGGPYVGGGCPPKGCGGKGSKGGKGGKGIKTDKIFVGGLPPDCAEEKLVAHFEVYGTLVDAVVMKEKGTGKPRGFGFVRYDNTDSADQVMADFESHVIDGKWVECKRATPQEQMDAPRAGFAPAYGGYAPQYAPAPAPALGRALHQYAQGKGYGYAPY